MLFEGQISFMSHFLHTTDFYHSHVLVIDAIVFCVSSSNALQQRPSLRGGGGELPDANGWRGPVEP